MNGEDCGARGFPLSVYCCIPLQPQVHINQLNVLVEVEVYGFQISCEQNGQATGGECGEIRWKGENRQLEEDCGGDRSVGLVSVASVQMGTNFLTLAPLKMICVCLWSLSPRHGVSSGCGWRNGLRYGG